MASKNMMNHYHIGGPGRPPNVFPKLKFFSLSDLPAHSLEALRKYF